MKKLFISIFILTFIFSTIFNFNTSAATIIDQGEIDGLNWSLERTAGMLYILNIHGNGDITFNGSSAPWYPQIERISELRIEEGITSIGENAFSHMRRLTTVSIPSSVTVIERRAFEMCENLEFVNIPEDSLLEKIGDNAFESCYVLGNIYLPYNLREVGEYAFSGCDGMTRIDIPANLTVIGEGAFSGHNLNNISVTLENPDYSSLDGILFNKNQTRLIKYPGGKTYENYTVPESVTTIATNAFEGCRNLKNITMSDNVTVLENHAFHACYSLETVDLSENITEIPSTAFAWCSKLKSITIPEKVTAIHLFAFWQCKGLTSITIPRSVKSIGERAFEYATGLTTVYYTGTQSEWNTLCANMGSLNEPLLNANIIFQADDMVETSVKTFPKRLFTDNILYTVGVITEGDNYDASKVKAGININEKDYWFKNTPISDNKGTSYFIIALTDFSDKTNIKPTSPSKAILVVNESILEGEFVSANSTSADN